MTPSHPPTFALTGAPRPRARPATYSGCFCGRAGVPRPRCGRVTWLARARRHGPHACCVTLAAPRTPHVSDAGRPRLRTTVILLRRAGTRWLPGYARDIISGAACCHGVGSYGDRSIVVGPCLQGTCNNISCNLKSPKKLCYIQAIILLYIYILQPPLHRAFFYFGG